MENKIFDAITGKVSTGSPLITAPGGSCEDAINVVFPQSGIAWNRQGHAVFGPVEPSIDNITPNPTLTDWGYINQYPYPDSRYTSRINSWNSLNEPFRFNIQNKTDIKGVLSLKPVLPGLKVDRYADYGDYNPKEGFSDTIIEVDEATGLAMLGWIGNNGRVEGFSNNNLSVNREDLYRYIYTDQSFSKAAAKTGPIFSSSWLNSAFDSCVTVQDYRFLDFGQNRLVMADTNKWLRVFQQKDVVSGTKTEGKLTQRPAFEDFTTPNEPARCWRYSVREKVSLPAYTVRYKGDTGGWLQDGYAVDVFAVLKFTDETGAVFYGAPSQVVTCKNFRQGLANVLVAPEIDLYNASNLAEQITIEIYRTKQYKWFGNNTEQPPTVFYLCYSERASSFFYYMDGSKYGKYAVTWSVSGSPTNATVTLNNATDPFIKAAYTDVNGDFLLLSSSIDTSWKSANFIAKLKAGLRGNSADLCGGTLNSIRYVAKADSGGSYQQSVYSTTQGTPYELMVPLYKLSGSSFTPSIQIYHDFEVSGFPTPGTSTAPVLCLTEPELYGAVELSLSDSSLIEVWSESTEYVLQDTYPLVGGAVAFRGRVIGYNAVLPPTALLNQTKFSKTSAGISATQVLQEDTTDTYADGSFLLNTSYLLSDSLRKEESDLLYKSRISSKIVGTEKTTKSYQASSSGSMTTLNEDGASHTVSELQQQLISVAYDSAAKTLAVKTNATVATWQDIPTTGVVLLWRYNSTSYTFTTDFSLFDMVAYGGVSDSYSGGVRTVTFSDVVSVHTVSYNSDDPIATSSVFATLLTASGKSAVPVWITDAGYAFGVGRIRYNGSGTVLPTTRLSSEPTGFVSSETTSYEALASWTHNGTGGRAPTISSINIQTVQYQAVTAALLMSESLRKFANDLDAKTTYKVAYSTYDPLQISIQKMYYGSEANGSGRATNMGLTLGYNQYTPDDTQLFDVTLMKSPSSFSDLASISTHVPNAVVFSKPNRYDVCDPLGNLLKIGDDNKPITNIVEFNGALYVFKEEEGIYRLIVDESNTFASSVTLIDNTHWMISNRSVQLVMDGLYFVSNRGISLLTASESVIDISDGIHQEVATYIADVAANDDLGTHPQERMARISSYANEARRLYAVHFPRCGTHKRGVTLVYSGNTNQWSKSDQRFEASWTVQDKTYTIEPVYAADDAGDDTMVREATLFKKDNASSDLYAVADQHDGYFSTSEVRYYNGAYKYNPTTGIVQIIDTRSLPTSTTDGLSFSNFHRANKGKYIYITLFGTEYKATYDLSDYTISSNTTLVSGTYDKITVPVGVTLTITGEVTAYSVDVAGNLDVSGELDVISIDSSYVPLQLIADAYPVAPDPFVKAVTLTAGICASMTFNPFFVAENQGKARFFEGFVTSRGSCKGVQLAFKTSSVTSWTASCTIGQTAEVFRTFVPRQATIGRWIQLNAQHSQPREFFKPYSIGYWFRPFVQGNKSTRNLEA